MSLADLQQLFAGVLTRFTTLEPLRALKARYAQLTDENHRAPTHASAVAAANLFADDGILDIGPGAHFVGRAAILDAYENLFPAATTWSTNYVTNPQSLAGIRRPASSLVTGGSAP